MKVSRQKAAENRESIVEAASRLLREKGVAAVGVAEVSEAAGLTHGGFYRQFASKEALVGEACELALRDTGAELAKAMARPRSFVRFAEGYLSRPNIEGPPCCCPVAALGADVARLGPETKAAFARGLRSMLAAGREVTVGSTEWSESTASFATLLGALIMARAVAGADDELVDAIVASAKKAVEST